MSIDDLKGTANLLRAKIKDVGDEVKRFKEDDVSGTLAGYDATATPFDAKPIDKGEAIANVQLAYRHLEDARMRLGKCIQALDGGTSINDKPEQQQA